MSEQQGHSEVQSIVDQIAKALLGTLEAQNLGVDMFHGMVVLVSALAAIVTTQHGIKPDALFASIRDSIPTEDGRELVRMVLGARMPLEVIEGGKRPEGDQPDAGP